MRLLRRKSYGLRSNPACMAGDLRLSRSWQLVAPIPLPCGLPAARFPLPRAAVISTSCSAADASLERYSQGDEDEDTLQHLLDEVRNYGLHSGGGL